MALPSEGERNDLKALPNARVYIHHANDSIAMVIDMEEFEKAVGAEFYKHGTKANLELIFHNVRAQFLRESYECGELLDMDIADTVMVVWYKPPVDPCADQRMAFIQRITKENAEEANDQTT